MNADSEIGERRSVWWKLALLSFCIVGLSWILFGIASLLGWQEPGPGVGSRGSVRAVYSSFMNPCLFLFMVLDVLRLYCLEQVNFAVDRGFNMTRCI